MQLLESVRMHLTNTKKPHQKFVCHMLRVLWLLPGQATLRNLSRDSAYPERTFARWYGRAFDCVALHKAAIRPGIPPAQAQAFGIDASFIPTSGKKTYGLDRFWNGSHRRAEKGRDISALAWLDITAPCAYGLRVEQTPCTDQTTDPETTRSDVSLEQVPHVVSAQHLHPLRYVITDGYYRKQQFLRGVRALGLQQLGKRRLDAHLRPLDHGQQRPGPGRPPTYDGKVHWEDLTRFTKVTTDDAPLVLSHQVLNHGQCQCNLRVVRVVDTTHHRRAVLFRPAIALDARSLYRYDKARFHIEFLCRDAKQVAGLTACHARSPTQLHFYFNASLWAVTLAKLEARPQPREAASVFARARLQRRAFNQHLIERISQHLAQGYSLENSSPDYEALGNYGAITATAA